MSLREALGEWTRALGEENVTSDPAVLANLETATFPTDQKIAASISPGDRSEVQLSLQIATKFGVPIYPVSGGKNWGLGSRVPVQSGAAVMDLSRMNRIVDYDEELATITVEPGVTFAQAHEFLKAKNSALLLNTPGTSPRASLIGNAIERGDGVGPTGDRFLHSCGLVAITAAGEIVETGFERFEGSKLKRIYRGAVGPSLEGLFVQSNLGVVVQMTFWLMPRPAFITMYRFGLSTSDQVEQAFAALRRLRLEGTLNTSFAVWNDFRVISVRQRFPWDLTEGATPLTREQLETTDVGRTGQRWFGVGAIYSPTRALSDATRERVSSLLAEHTEMLVFYEKEQSTGEIREHLIRGEKTTLATFGNHQNAFIFLEGIPQEASQLSMYWRKKGPPPKKIDPEGDRCGVLWSCPVTPLRGRDFLEAAALVESITLRHGFEPLIAGINTQERTIYLVPLLIYDRDVAGDDQRALLCHDELIGALIEKGYTPYRLGIQSMDVLAGEETAFRRVLGEIRRTLDPNGILAPGRYELV